MAKAKNPAAQIDKSNMFDVLYAFPDQVKEAVSIGEHAPLWRRQFVSNRFAIFGLGGSAIGGDLLRSYAAATPGADHLQISVHRGYTAPTWLDADTNTVFSSYSGETEETLSAFDDARKRSDRGLVITTGGSLGKRGVTFGLPIINIPPGYQPRCAIAFSFFPLLMAMTRSGAMDGRAARANTKGIKEIIAIADARRDEYASKSAKNPAFALAKKLQDTIPVIYSANERMDTVNLRWRGQIQENAKQIAFGNQLPEMNHNEINGWQFPKALTKQASVVLLRDADDHARVKVRFDALEDIIKKSVKTISTVQGEGATLLGRMFSAIYLGDWVSWHLAILNDVDPTPVPVIQSLKAALAKKK
ncbi:MAG: bifunctional phosphoglucose/phosphomannose isomerase [Candidatus Kapabacteria bacterium]|nr:bifunctional phosphoglucose/phosphomannose isomerase [Candidatus Kapabacteria bacterium]